MPGIALPIQGHYVLERYHQELLNFLCRQVNNRDVAADLTQESFVRALASQSAGRPVLDMRALLYRTARNLLIDQHRRSQIRHHEDLDAIPADSQPQAPKSLQPDELLASRQVIHAYLETIDSLPERCREAFVLHVFDEFSHAQIAARMNISISMVEKHVVRAMLACKLCERRLRDDAALRSRP